MITLDTILNILKKDQNFRDISYRDDLLYTWPKPVTFDHLTYNSQTATTSSLFFAKGLNFKASYLEGLQAPFYISEQDYQTDKPVILVNNVKQAMSLIAQHFYDYPQKALKLIAFTGTKGKTTTAYFTKHILDLTTHNKTAMLSTMNTTLDGVHYFKSQLTTPESLDLFEMMAKARDNGMLALIMEVSSQAYKTQRVYGLTFDIAVFLNISPDHIGPIEHPNFEDYFYCKRQLLEHAKHVIVNSDMDYFPLIRDQIADQAHDTYGSLSDNKISASTSLQFTTQGKVSGTFDLQLLGRYNQENALAAMLVAKALGAKDDELYQGIKNTRVPGRMEILETASHNKIYVDYAHNGVSLDKLIQVVSHAHQGEITLILGSPGNKAESRRKDFGLLLEQYPQLKVILTADDPNFEDPHAISQNIASYISRPVQLIDDRIEAIHTGIDQLTTVDSALIIAGKGADNYQIISGKKETYPGDYVVAQNYLAAYK